MTAHLSNEDLDKYCERGLSLADLARVNDHLFSCENCYDQFLTVFQSKRKFPIEIDLNELAGLNGWHLQGDELKNYVEGRLGEFDLAFANTHLRECAWCKEEVHHVSEFTDKLQQYLSKRHTPLKQPTLWRLVKLDTVFRFPLVSAKAAALVLLVLGSAIILWSVLRTNPGRQDARQPASLQEKTPLTADAPKNMQSANDLSVAQSSQPSGSDMPEGEDPSDNAIRRSATPSTPAPPSMPKQRTAVPSGQGGEAILIAENLVMPRVVEAFDRAPVVLRGSGNHGESFRVVSPYATVIREVQPTFHWTPLLGAASYIVSIYDDKLNLVKKSEPLTKAHWQMPKQLKRGVLYTWVVTAQKDGKELLAPELPARAEFKVIEGKELITLSRRISQYHSGAARGVLYAKAGLLDLAEQEFQSYLYNHPTDETVKRLLQTVKSWREP